MLGFKRYFTLENMICKTLFDLAQKPPTAWKAIKIKVTRRERVQTASGAVQSALYGAAFQIQAANMRAAANHVIQSTGAQITKRLQRQIWEIQPAGIHSWRTRPMNVHDEVMAITNPAYTKDVERVVNETVESFRPKVPLIQMKWLTNVKSWAEK